MRRRRTRSTIPRNAGSNPAPSIPAVFEHGFLLPKSTENDTVDAALFCGGVPEWVSAKVLALTGIARIPLQAGPHAIIPREQ